MKLKQLFENTRFPSSKEESRNFNRIDSPNLTSLEGIGNVDGEIVNT